MRRFYDVFKDIKFSPLARTLSWSHYMELLPLKDVNTINYYISISNTFNLTKRELREKIKSKEYERLPNNTKDKLIRNEKLEVIDSIPNPIVLKKDCDYEKITELLIKEMILKNMNSFLKQLGKGFDYIGNECKIKLDNYNYIDILLYNVIYKCYVVVELKATKLKKDHIGQIETYMGYVDKIIRNSNDNETLGIILCKKGNKYITEYCSNKKIFEREYIIL